MAIQTVYKENQDAGRLGGLVDVNNKNVFDAIAKAQIGFGVPVVYGDTDGSARATEAGDTAIIGVTVRERSTMADVFEIGDSMRIVDQGSIWVTASVAVSAGDPVDVIVATGAFTNTGGVTIAGARFDSSAEAAELVKIRLA